MGVEGIRHNKLFPLKVLDRITVIFLYRAYHRHFGRWIFGGSVSNVLTIFMQRITSLLRCVCSSLSGKFRLMNVDHPGRKPTEQGLPGRQYEFLAGMWGSCGLDASPFPSTLPLPFLGTLCCCDTLHFYKYCSYFCHKLLYF